MLVLFRTVIAPEFASKTDDELSAMFAFVEQSLTLSVFGTRANEAVMLLAAHRFTLQARRAAGSASGGVGPVKSKGAGGLSISYGSSGMTASGWGDEALAQTGYGLDFLALRDSRACGRMGIA